VWVYIIHIKLVSFIKLYEVTNTGDGRNGSKLMDDVTWEEVDVIVSETDAKVANAVSSKSIEFGFLHPLDTLRDGGFMEIQL